ncbi:DUF4307 domain-containing protein [Streptomyces sp. NPDC051776]|uniref:DUF4307 domain-containing protein n=1 Tax=Streptomyces sp. NPDC051776 TaxID=3155414 RepID=UPI003426A9AA
MAASGEKRAAARYGRTADARADRKLKIIGAALGVVMLGVTGWFGFSYVSGQKVTGELIKFKVVSDTSAEVHLEVRKDAGTPGVCTVFAQAEDGSEVGWKDLRFDEHQGRVDKVGTIRTTQRATAVELIGCKPASGG